MYLCIAAVVSGDFVKQDIVCAKLGVGAKDKLLLTTFSES